MAYARDFSGLWVAPGVRKAPGPATAAAPHLHQWWIGALGLICPSGDAGAPRIRETWASSRSRPRCTDVSGFDPLEGSASLLTELVSAAILSPSPARAKL